MSPRYAIRGKSVSRDLEAKSRKIPPKPTQLVLVEDQGLQRLNARPPLGKYMHQVWRRRHFIAAHARSRALRAGQDMFLGKLWIVLSPIVSVAVFAVIFGMVLNVSRGMDNFVGFLIIGVIYFGFLTSGISGGSGLIKESKKLMNAFTFPKATLVFAVVLRQFLDNLVPAIIAIVGAVIFQLGSPIHWTIVLVVPIFFLIHLFILGIAFITARITAFVPDFRKIIELINRALFFTSGVFFPVERFADVPIIREVMLANPLYQFLTAVRDCVLHGNVPPLEVWLYLCIWAFGILLIGFIFFWRAEERYASAK